MNKLSFFLLFFLLGCVPSFNQSPKNIYLKKIIVKDAEIQWFYWTFITNETPDFVIISYSDTTYDTVCQSDNICDVYLKGFDTLFVVFKSVPQMYGNPVAVNTHLHNFHVVIDTTGTATLGGIKYSSSFKEKK